MQQQDLTKTVSVEIVNGFTKDGQGGNPAGIVLDADDLGEAQMQTVARAVGVSETVFVSSSEEAGFRFDFFTPNRRIAHCGHATIAAFSYLAQIGKVENGGTSKMTVDGPRKIFIRGTQSFMEQVAPRYENASSWQGANVSVVTVLAALGLKPSDLLEGYDPQVVNTGNSFMIIPIREPEQLGKILPNHDAIRAISEALDLIGFYAFAPCTTTQSADAITRMFAPRYAIEEEAATGMAAGPLACYLYDVIGMRQQHFDIDQGDFMSPPSPSRISVELELNAFGSITGLLAGGYGKSMRNLQVTL